MPDAHGEEDDEEVFDDEDEEDEEMLDDEDEEERLGIQRMTVHDVHLASESEPAPASTAAAPPATPAAAPELASNRFATTTSARWVVYRICCVFVQASFMTCQGNPTNSNAASQCCCCCSAGRQQLWRPAMLKQHTVAEQAPLPQDLTLGLQAMLEAPACSFTWGTAHWRLQPQSSRCAPTLPWSITAQALQ